jgi:abhydrolase domain-containing protein 17
MAMFAFKVQDISAVFNWAQTQYGARPQDIVLYGQSVGSGPTCWLASKTPLVAGVVLHSAFISGLRVLKPQINRWPSWLDVFPNFKHVPKMQCPALVIHVRFCFTHCQNFLNFV